jgi:N-acetylmuramoyl-L-alanine amidase
MIILDAGHGGMINGVYQTAGKRSPIWEDGRQLFEGVFNRGIVEKLHKICEYHSIDSHILVPEQEDISLRERVRRANVIYKDRKDAIYISVHANAGGGTGFEIFTSVGVTQSDSIAEDFIFEFAEAIPELKLRADDSDGDKDKEAHFYVLKETHCPAVLIETAFMDTYEPDCKMMLDDEDRFVEAIFNGIVKIKCS